MDAVRDACFGTTMENAWSLSKWQPTPLIPIELGK